MTEYNFSEGFRQDRRSHEQDWHFRFLFGVMTAHAQNFNDWKEAFNIPQINSGSNEDIVVDVKVTINGVEVPYHDFIARLEAGYEACCEERARELVKEKFGDIEGKMYELGQAIDASIDEAFPGYRR